MPTRKGYALYQPSECSLPLNKTALMIKGESHVILMKSQLAS
jgi:hypothetical protein